MVRILGNTWPRGGSGLLRGLLVAAWVSAAAAAEPSADRPPAERPTTGSAPAKTVQPPSAGINISAEAIKLSDGQKTVLADVRDGETTAEPAFYMLLGRLENQPPLDDGRKKALALPTVTSLLTHPSIYRGQLIRLDLHVMRVIKRLPGKDLSFSRWRPGAKPVWQLDCLNANTADRTARYEQPVIVFSTADPAEVLHGPRKVTKTGHVHYPGGPVLEVIGVFYKYTTMRDRDDAKTRDYPVIVAWQMERASARTTSRDLSLPTVILLLVLVLAGAFVYLMHYTRKQRRRGRKDYQPLRDGMKAPATSAAPSQQQMEVDPDLMQASREHLKERQDRDAADRGS